MNRCQIYFYLIIMQKIEGYVTKLSGIEGKLNTIIQEQSGYLHGYFLLQRFKRQVGKYLLNNQKSGNAIRNHTTNEIYTHAICSVIYVTFTVLHCPLPHHNIFVPIVMFRPNIGPHHDIYVPIVMF